MKKKIKRNFKRILLIFMFFLLLGFIFRKDVEVLFKEQRAKYFKDIRIALQVNQISANPETGPLVNTPKKFQKQYD